MVSEAAELTFMHHHAADEMSAYERLLGDAIAGDPITSEPNPSSSSRRICSGVRPEALPGRTATSIWAC